MDYRSSARQPQVANSDDEPDTGVHHLRSGTAIGLFTMLGSVLLMIALLSQKWYKVESAALGITTKWGLTTASVRVRNDCVSNTEKEFKKLQDAVEKDFDKEKVKKSWDEYKDEAEKCLEDREVWVPTVNIRDLVQYPEMITGLKPLNLQRSGSSILTYGNVWVAGLGCAAWTGMLVACSLSFVGISKRNRPFLRSSAVPVAGISGGMLFVAFLVSWFGVRVGMIEMSAEMQFDRHKVNAANAYNKFEAQALVGPIAYITTSGLCYLIAALAFMTKFPPGEKDEGPQSVPIPALVSLGTSLFGTLMLLLFAFFMNWWNVYSLGGKIYTSWALRTASIVADLKPEVDFQIRVRDVDLHSLVMFPQHYFGPTISLQAFAQFSGVNTGSAWVLAFGCLAFISAFCGLASAMYGALHPHKTCICVVQRMTVFRFSTVFAGLSAFLLFIGTIVFFAAVKWRYYEFFAQICASGSQLGPHAIGNDAWHDCQKKMWGGIEAGPVLYLLALFLSGGAAGMSMVLTPKQEIIQFQQNSRVSVAQQQVEMQPHMQRASYDQYSQQAGPHPSGYGMAPPPRMSAQGGPRMSTQGAPPNWGPQW